MKKMALLAIVSAIAATTSFSAFATGNGAPSGAHYNLNIIGVDKAKKPTMTGSQGHTIFVPLKSEKTGIYSTNNNVAIVDSKIWLLPGDDFQVCDRNAFDAAYACDGSLLGQWLTSAIIDTTDPALDQNNDGKSDYPVQVVTQKAGAVFELPCNTNLNGQTYVDSATGQTKTLDALISCNEVVNTAGEIVPVAEANVVPTANYQVWARALGTPGGSATVTTCATVQGELQCSLENTVLTRTKGPKPTFTDVTDALTSLVVDYCFAGFDADGVCLDTELTTRVALFAGDTQDWFWNYDNNGLRLAQLRFYEVPAAQ